MLLIVDEDDENSTGKCDFFLKKDNRLILIRI